MERILASLDGTWQLRPVEAFAESYPRDGWLEAEVPGHWQDHALLAKYAGKAVYRRSFRLSPQPDRRYWLRLGGVFYWSTVRLNGSSLGSHEGYFSPQTYEITRSVGERNRVVVEVDCPDQDDATRKRMITGVFSHWDAMDPETNPGGIWRPVALLETGRVAIKTALFRTAALSSDAAEIVAQVRLDSDYSGPARLRVGFVPHNFRARPQIREEEIVLSPGETLLERSYQLEGPRLWWTHDLGRPNLYRIIVEVQAEDGKVSDRLETLFGIRRFELENWIPSLNGRRVFLKGSNYGPGDARMARMTQSRYRRDLKLAVEANMNFLRVHGHVEASEFYGAADEAGVLLWQDFPLQWLYSKDVLGPALDQVEEMVRFLSHHPSVAIWCMHNEPFGVTDSLKLRGGGLRGRWQFLRMLWTLYGYSWNREVLDSRLAARAQELDPSRPVVRSSGEWALPWRRGTDGHHYHGWYPQAGPLSRLDRDLRWFLKNFRFVTEFGAQSFPNLESSRKFAAGALEELDWDRLEERHQLQRDHLRRWVAVDDMPTLEALIAASQEYQAGVNQYFVDRLRRRKYLPTGGIANFMFHDPNPAVSWSVLDHWRVPKRSYDRLAQAYHPEYVFVLMDRARYRVGEEIEIPIYVVNDGHRDQGSVRVSVQVFDEKGQVRLEAGFSSQLPADSMAIEIGRVRTRFQESGTRRLVLRLFYGAQVFENSYRLTVTGGS